MRRRTTAAAVAVAAAGIFATALTGCGQVLDAGTGRSAGSSPSPSTTSGPSLYTDVSARMVAAGTAQFVFSGSGGGRTLSGSGTMRFTDGAYDAAVELTMPEIGQVRAVLMPAASYLALPAAKGLPRSKPWVKVSPSPRTPVGKDLAPVVDQLRTAFDPTQSLGLLRSATRVTEVGPATVEGEATTHYHADVSLRRATQSAAGSVQEQYQSMLDAGAETLNYDLWVDTTGLPLRYTLDLPAGEQLFSITGVYRAWGERARIQQPSTKQVFDADKLTP